MIFDYDPVTFLRYVDDYIYFIDKHSGDVQKKILQYNVQWLFRNEEKLFCISSDSEVYEITKKQCSYTIWFNV